MAVTTTTTDTLELCGACEQGFPTLSEVFSHPCPAIEADRLPFQQRHATRDSDNVDRDLPNGNGGGTGSGAPKSQPASDKQVAFIESLAAERQQALAAANDTRTQVTLARDGKLGKREASQLIDALKALPRDEAKPKAPAEPQGPQVEEGFYITSDDTVYKVQVAVHGSGNLYGKRLNPATGSFDYEASVPRKLRALMAEGQAERLTLERAKQLGHLYGMCCVCGRTLTDEGSIEAGIGPVCAKRVDVA